MWFLMFTRILMNGSLCSVKVSLEIDSIDQREHARKKALLNLQAAGQQRDVRMIQRRRLVWEEPLE